MSSKGQQLLFAPLTFTFVGTAENAFQKQLQEIIYCIIKIIKHLNWSDPLRVSDKIVKRNYVIFENTKLSCQKIKCL